MSTLNIAFLSQAFSEESEGTWYLAFRDAWFRVCSRYIVSATPPTVLDRSFVSASYSFGPILLKLYKCFNHGLKICMCFLQILKLFFFSLFSNLRLFCMVQSL